MTLHQFTNNTAGEMSLKQDRDTLYGLSWSNTKWNPQLINSGNILEYFSDRTNPFYDRECNNELIRMQRLTMDKLITMQGVEYYLHSAQEPILYVICKQQRHNTTTVTPLAMYYIINGVVHQSPDLSAVINARLHTSLHYLNSAFQEMMHYSNYQPTTGTYSWNFTSPEEGSQSKPTIDDESEGTAFQRQRVDLLLGDWMTRFPAPELPLGPLPTSAIHQGNVEHSVQHLASAHWSHMSPAAADLNGQQGPPPDKKFKLES